MGVALEEATDAAFDSGMTKLLEAVQQPQTAPRSKRNGRKRRGFSGGGKQRQGLTSTKRGSHGWLWRVYIYNIRDEI